MAGRSVVEVINRLLIDWASPREPEYFQEANLRIKMPERCSAERSKGPLTLGADIPDDLKEFWGRFFSATLFEDVDYGQWGLRLFDYEMSDQLTREFNEERPQDAARGDRVIGRFIGDADRVVIRCITGESDFGSIIIALNEGMRNDWPRPSSSLSSFLEEYSLFDGQKFWEPRYREQRESFRPPT